MKSKNKGEVILPYLQCTLYIVSCFANLSKYKTLRKVNIWILKSPKNCPKSEKCRKNDVSFSFFNIKVVLALKVFMQTYFEFHFWNAHLVFDEPCKFQPCTSNEYCVPLFLKSPKNCPTSENAVKMTSVLVSLILKSF